ncbi:MAG: hypothetical protein IPJ82_12925 [Lewinellaceae bacterium]|nr:hypothetical protein [Lewinellaceae bacterium]
MTQYYLDRIESGESCLFDELSSCWDDMFAQPILEAWLASDSPNYSYLWLLNAHPGSWENIPGAKERLAAKVFDLFGISPQQKIPADRLGESLSQIANVLQVTRDSSAAIFLSQYLTDNTPTGREKLGLPFYSEPYLRPLRNCDKALEAIYYILGRDIRAEYYKALFPQQAPKVWIVNGAKKHYDVPEILFDKTWMTEQRDRLIKELQKEMSE